MFTVIYFFPHRNSCFNTSELNERYNLLKYLFLKPHLLQLFYVHNLAQIHIKMQ